MTWMANSCGAYMASTTYSRYQTRKATASGKTKPRWVFRSSWNSGDRWAAGKSMSATRSSASMGGWVDMGYLLM